MKYDIQFTNQFKKDLKLAKKQNKNLDKLFEVIDILANGGTLEAKYRDHDLTGNYKGTRECHIEPDWVLIYEIQNNVLVLMLYRLGRLLRTIQKIDLKTRIAIQKASIMVGAFLIVPQYYVESNHEAIIPKDIFLQVQEELVRRRVVKTSANGKKRSYSCNHCFAQIVICGECGEMFRRIHWNNRGCKSIVWRCISRLEPTGQECHARTVNETILENVVVQAINTLLGDKSTYQAQLQQNIAKVIRSAQQNTTDGIDERLQELQKELLKKANNKEAYDEIADEIFKLREQREKCTVDTAARDAQITRINELQDFIKQQPAHLEAFDEALVKRWLERIIVWEDHFTVELKSGLKIEIEG